MECRLDNITVSYESLGEGRPFLMLHGAMGDHTFWQQVLEPLFEKRAGWRRIYVDLPGHGETAGPTWLQTEELIVEVLLQFIDRVCPGEHFTLGGFSWGGHLARGILYHRMAQIEGVLLIAPSFFGTHFELPPRTVTFRDEAAVVEMDWFLKDIIENGIVAQDRATIDRVLWLEPALRKAEQDDAMFAAELDLGFSFPADQLPVPFERPALFLLERQDQVVGYRAAWNLIEQYPRATFAVLDRAGHFVASAEQVDLCARLIEEWLMRVAEGSRA